MFQPIKSTMDQHTTNHYSGLLNQLVDQAKAMFRETDPANGKIIRVLNVKILHRVKWITAKYEKPCTFMLLFYIFIQYTAPGFEPTTL